MCKSQTYSLCIIYFDFFMFSESDVRDVKSEKSGGRGWRRDNWSVSGSWGDALPEMDDNGE